MNNAKEFLEYIAKNERRLKKNLKKNITYDDNLFEDVFQMTIIKVYESIVKNDRHVEDFEKYFFISSKFEYILQDNRRKKKLCNHDDIEEAKKIIDDSIYYNEEENELTELLICMKNYVTEIYGSFEATIFFEYFQMKTEKNCSYKKIADEYNLQVKDVCNIIKKIKNDDKLKYYQTKFKYIKYDE